MVIDKEEREKVRKVRLYVVAIVGSFAHRISDELKIIIIISFPFFSTQQSISLL